MRVIIEQDMEGVAGVLHWARDLKAAGTLDAALRWMTDEVNAAVDGACAAGAKEVMLLEAHPFDYERLDARAVVSQRPIVEIADPADALFFVGRHAMSGVADGPPGLHGAVAVLHKPFSVEDLLNIAHGPLGLSTGSNNA